MDELEVKVLFDVVSNDDNYEWKHLGCFYKPLGIMHRYYHKDYSSYFLLSTLGDEIFKQFDWSEDFEDTYNNTIGKVLNTAVDGGELNEKQQFCDRIIGYITNDIPVLVPVDLYNVYYETRYMKEHHIHYILIKGFDRTRRLFYCLDTLHNDNLISAIYKEDIITFDLLWEQSIHGVIVLNKAGDVQDKRILLKGILDNIETYNLHTSEQYFKNSDKGLISKGIESVNKRVPFYSEVINFISSVSEENNKVDLLKNLGNEIVALWSKVGLWAIYCFECNRDFDDNGEINKIVLKELEYFKLLKAIIYESSLKITKKQLNTELPKHKNIKYRVVNGKKVEIIDQDNSILIRHNKKYLSNIWFDEDNGPQVYFDYNTKKFNCIHLKLEFRVDPSTTKSICFQDGIILAFEDKTKYLYGITETELLNVICFEKGIDDRILVKPEQLCLEIVSEGNDFYFNYKYVDENEYKNFYHIHAKAKLNKVGLFSRTWEYINHDTKFSDIEIH